MKCGLDSVVVVALWFLMMVTVVEVTRGIPTSSEKRVL